MILAFFALATIRSASSSLTLASLSLPFHFSFTTGKDTYLCSTKLHYLFSPQLWHFLLTQFPDTGLFDKISISYSSNPTLLLYFWLLPAISQISRVINPIEGLTTHSWESALSWCSYESHHVTTTTVWDSPSLNIVWGLGRSVVLL